MSGILQGWLSKKVVGPRGAWTALDQIKKGMPARAFKAQNVRFAPGHAYSREGMSARLTVLGKVTALHNWITSSANLVVYFESGTTIKAVNAATGVITTLASGLSGRSICVAEAGTRAYISAYATTGLGSAQIRVTDGSATDKAFESPVAATFTATDNGAGLCTKGTHKIGFIFQTRSGFAGKPSPVDGGGVFSPATVTLGANKRTIRASLSWTVPAEGGAGAAVYPIITRADNPDKWFFVPGMDATPTVGSWSHDFDISVTDEDLANRAEDADNWFNCLTQDGAGAGPFSPSVVFSYGHRNVYIVDNKAYVSEIDDTQFVTEDFNVIQVAGQKRIVTGIEQGSMYLFCEKSTHESTDNGDTPATWAQPKEVSGALGAPFPACVKASGAKNRAWVANEAGLWVFEGGFPDRPLSYLQADQWARINWAAGYAVQIAEDTVNRRVHVAVPLDAATEPSHVFVWDYTNGLTPEEVDFSLDNFAWGAFSAIGAVKEPATGRSLLWVGPTTAGSIMKADSTTHNDNGAAINSLWESGWIWDEGDRGVGQLNRVGLLHVCISGSGNLIVNAYGKDRTLAATPAPQALVTAPGYERLFRFDLSPIEECSIRIETNAADAWLDLTDYTAYYKPVLTHRF